MDIQLSYTKAGAGKPLVLLHGNGEDATTLKNQIEYFADQYCVYAINTRGHGQTPRGTAPFTITQFAQDLHGFLQQHNLENIRLVGFSDGGNIALVFAARYAQKVCKLVVCGANLKPSGMRWIALAPCWLQWLFYVLRGKQGKQKRELMELMLLQPHISAADLSRIKAPVLVLAGTQDLVAARHTKKIAAQICNSKLMFIKGGHWLPQAKPSLFNAAVDAFLKN